MSSRLAAATLASTLLLGASESLAQAPAAPPGPPPGAPYGQPPADDEVRVRWGISGFGGKYFVDGAGGGVGGLDVRVGAQINNMIGVYGTLPVMAGAGVSASTTATGASSSVSAIALWGVGALVDFTFIDMVFVAAGPEFLRGGGGAVSAKADASGGSTSASGEAGTFLGFEARAGVALGSVKPNRRKAFTIGLDLHVVNTYKPTVIPLLALGYDAF